MRRFCLLLQGCQARDLIALCDMDQLFGAIQVYDAKTMCVKAVEAGEIPWQIAWVAARFHKKHRFSTNKKPCLVQLRKALITWREKARWRRALWDVERPLHTIRVRARVVPTCGVLLDNEYLAWTNYFVSEVLRRASGALHNSGWGRDEPLRLLSAARRALTRHKLVLVPNDKEPGLSLLSFSDVHASHRAVLAKHWYEETTYENVDVTGVASHYRKLAKRIAQFEDDDQLVATLNRSLRGGLLFATLMITVKTHKAPGCVGVRNIHGAKHYMFEGIAAWLGHKLKQLNADLGHLLCSTNAFHDRVSRIACDPSDDYWIKLDVKDFFLSGQPFELVDDALADWCSSGEERHLYSDVLYFLLFHQYVRSNEMPGRSWRVVRGSGMGLKHSSDLMDWCFYSRCEKALLPSAKSCGIKTYLRYRDDILILPPTRRGTMQDCGSGP